MNYDNIQDEIEHVDQWAKNNNLILNKDKSREIIFRGNKSVQVIPPPLDDITRVNSLKKLGVIFQDKLIMKSHVDAILAKCASMIYALNLLRNHGLNQDGLQRVFEFSRQKLYLESHTLPPRGVVWLVMRNIEELTHSLTNLKSLVITLQMVKTFKPFVTL